MENQQTENVLSRKLKWWQAVLVILAIMFFPITIIWYIWAKTKLSKRNKSLVTAGVIVLFITAVIIINNSDTTQKNVAVNNPPVQQSETQNNADTKPQPKAEPVSPAKPLSEEDQIRQLVTSQFKGKNNMDKDYIRKVEVMEQIDGGWGVFTEYNTANTSTVNMRKKAIELDMAKIYTALYKSGKNIQTASVSAYFPLADKYGNNSDGVVYKTMLEKTEADKVNWELDKAYLGLEILPNVWETTWIHPEFK